MKRLGVVVGVLLAFAAASAHAPAVASADGCSPDGDCTKPDCTTSISARGHDAPGAAQVRSRRVDTSGRSAGARDDHERRRASMIYIDLSMDADAPAHDSATIAVTAREQTVDVTLGIDVLPASQNSPPVCQGDIGD
jgi:hypothetical protein